MGRLNKRLKRTIIRRRLRVTAFVGVLLCLTLLYCGLTVADRGFKETMGNKDAMPIFGIYGLHEPVIRLEFAGNGISIDKDECIRVYAVMKQRIKDLAGGL